MLANHGCTDSSGNDFITIAADECNGCGDFVTTFPAKAFAVVEEDSNDLMNKKPLSVAAHGKKKKLKYECGPCKLAGDKPKMQCVEACIEGAMRELLRQYRGGEEAAEFLDHIKANCFPAHPFGMTRRALSTEGGIGMAAVGLRFEFSTRRNDGQG